MVRHRRPYGRLHGEDYDRPSRRRRDRESYFSEGVSSGVWSYFNEKLVKIPGNTDLDDSENYDLDDEYDYSGFWPAWHKTQSKKIKILRKALDSLSSDTPLDPLVPLIYFCAFWPEKIPRTLKPSVGSYAAWYGYTKDHLTKRNYVISLSAVSVEKMFGSDPWEWFDNEVMEGYPKVRVKRMIQRERGKELSVSTIFKIDKLILP